MSRIKFQTLECPIGNAVAADTITPKVLPAPDKDYPWITGVWAKVITLPGGNSYLNAGLRDSTQGDIIDPCPVELLAGDASVRPEDKFVPIRIKNDGRSITATLKNPVLTTDALGKVVFVFRFEKVEEARPNA